METNFPSKQTGTKTGVAILISDKIDFKRRARKRDAEDHFIILKGIVLCSPRRHTHRKYICTEHRSTQIHKENLGGLQERY